MASVCFYFQVHQPYRLRRYSIFDTTWDYFDPKRNGEILKKVAERCYLPANQLMLETIAKYHGRFRIAYSLTGCAIEQLQEYAPKVIDSFKQLADTGCVEFLGETYYHSLAFLHSWDEFADQVRMHADMVQGLFGQKPTVFRNTELVYNNALAKVVGEMGYQAILSEGADSILGTRSPNVLYHAPEPSNLKVLLKNYRLSDDIAFRFSNRSWEQWPLTADKFAGWINQINGLGDVCNLFIDYETFGEHQWADTGIFDFMRYLPEKVMANKENDFLTPSEVANRYQACDVFDVPHTISWADTERDLSAWTGNAMQEYAMRELFKLEKSVKASGDRELITDWHRVTTSDHFYYMCTKYFSDGDVHKYFSPYESPYDSYINYMNVLDNISQRAKGIS